MAINIPRVTGLGGHPSLIIQVEGTANIMPMQVWVCLVDWVAERFKLCMEVVLRPKETRTFVLLPYRWIVERTFGWPNHWRRLSKSYERLTQADEAWVYIAMTCIIQGNRA